jgi:hypothetical protein
MWRDFDEHYQIEKMILLHKKANIEVFKKIDYSLKI